VEGCARRADVLAGHAERAAARMAAVLANLDWGDRSAAFAEAREVHTSLAVIAGELGRLHTELDERGLSTAVRRRVGDG
jgi:hypothetical protein